MEGDLPDPLDRLLRQSASLDRRHLQAGELPRLRLLHPAGDLDPVTYGIRRPIDAARRRLRTVRENDLRRRPLQPPIPSTDRQYCDTISFVSRRRDQRPDAHQRHLRDLRQTRPSAAPPATRSRSARRPRLVLDHEIQLGSAARAARTSSAPPHQLRAADPAPPDQREADEHRRTAVQLHRTGPDLPQRQQT